MKTYTTTAFISFLFLLLMFLGFQHNSFEQNPPGDGLEATLQDSVTADTVGLAS